MRQVQTTSVNAANLVTGARFVLAAAVGVVALADGPRWLLGVLVTVALLTDLVDGRLARRHGHGVRARRPARPGGRRAADPRAERGRGRRPRLVGARDRAGPLRLRRAVRAGAAAADAARRDRGSGARRSRSLVGVVLAVAAVLPLPDLVATVAVGGRRRCSSPSRSCTRRWTAGGRRAPPLVAPYGTVLAFLVVWLALVAPTDRDHLTVAGAAPAPARGARRGRSRAGAVAPAAGLLGRGVRAAAGGAAAGQGARPVVQRGLRPRTSTRSGTGPTSAPASGVLGDSIGAGWARVVAVLAGLATLARAGRRTARDGAAGAGRRATTAGSSLSAADGVRDGLGALPRHRRPGGAGAAVASTSAATLTVDEVQLVRADLADSQEFAQEIGTDAYAGSRPDRRRCSPGCRARTCCSSSSRATAGSPCRTRRTRAGIDQVLDQGTQQLTPAGYQSRSAFLTSPTFGAGSWLAHSTPAVRALGGQPAPLPAAARRATG